MSIAAHIILFCKNLIRKKFCIIKFEISNLVSEHSIRQRRDLSWDSLCLERKQIWNTVDWSKSLCVISLQTTLCSFLFPNELCSIKSLNVITVIVFFVIEKVRRTGSYLLCWAALSGDSLMSEGLFYQCSQSTPPTLSSPLLVW